MKISRMSLSAPGVHFVFLLLLLLPGLILSADKSRAHYGGKVLATPSKECSSSSHPEVKGTCMISLECQQRQGTVIGACRDGHLFGACCAHLPDTPQAPQPQKPPAPPSPNSKPFTIPPGLLNLAVFNIAGHSQNQPAEIQRESAFDTESPSSTKIPTTTTTTTTSTATTSKATTSTTTTTTTTSPAPEPSSTTPSKPSPETTTQSPNSVIDFAEKLMSVQTSLTTQPSHSPETRSTSVTNSPTPDSTSTTTTETTSNPVTASSGEVASTSKFVYGKIKYSPRPQVVRPTTEKRVWTRPTTTESTFSVSNLPNSHEEDEEEEEEDRDAKRKKGSSTLNTSAVTEVTTILPLTQSTEEQSTTLAPPQEHSEATSEFSVVSSIPTSTVVAPIPEPVVTESALTTSGPESHPPQQNDTQSPFQASKPLRKQSRISNEVEDEEPSSAGWDNQLNEFVNQVVEGIAVELDKSNIDEFVFKPKKDKKKSKIKSKKGSSTTTTPTTTTEEPTKPTKKTSKDKSKKKTTTTPTPKSSLKKKEKIKGVKSKTSPKPSLDLSESYELERDVLDYREVCGVRPLARHGRIVGGNPSTHGNWPWHALVKETVWWGIFSKVKCGGVLIGPRHVLTAAHCQAQKTGTLSVVLGVTDSDNPSTHAMVKQVRRIIPHPHFNPRSYENDIAILELDSPVQFQPHVVPVCLPHKDETFVGKKGFVTGMGLLKHDGERPSMLYEVDVPILNNTDCQKMFRRSGNMKPIKPSFICAGYRHGRKDSCGGDSGGPLSVKRPNGQWVLAGTVSHGIKCAVPNQPGIYMRTTWYLPWIQKVLSSARPDPKCPGPLPVCERRRQSRQKTGFLETFFRFFRIARKLWSLRKK